MATADLSGFEFFLPILSFLIVFIICFAVLFKIKIVESKWIQLLLSFIIAVIFVSAVGPREYILAVMPGFAVLIVALFLIMVLMGFVGKDIAGWNKGIGITFIILLFVIFVVTAIFVFSNYIGPYMPGSRVGGGNPDVMRFTGWLYSPKVAGALLLLAISAVVSWVLVKFK